MNLFDDALRQLDLAASCAEVEAETIARLRRPSFLCCATIPVRMDDGSMRFFEGYRVRYNDTRGPAKGGLRFHPSVDLGGLKALGLWMSLKCAVVGLPFGGGRGGIAVDPRELSRSELQRLSRGYMREFADVLRPDTDIPAPDVYTNARIMGWMADEYSRIRRGRLPAAITDKPIELEGIDGRDDTTGRGAFHCIDKLGYLRGWKPKATSVAIQGVGNAGQGLARLLFEHGYAVVAISDSKGGLYQEGGLDIPRLIDAKQSSRSLNGVYCGCSVCECAGCAGSSVATMSNAEFLELKVDILVPAALEQQITERNGDCVRAPVVVEVANGPVSAEADAALAARGVLVVPDVLAKAGGVTVSYFEWTQNKTGWTCRLGEVHRRLKRIMGEAFEQAFVLHREGGMSLRCAAYAMALERIGGAVRAQGTHEFFAHQGSGQREHAYNRSDRASASLQ